MPKPRGTGTIPGDVHASSHQLIMKAAGRLICAKTLEDINEVKAILDRVLEREAPHGNVIDFDRPR